MANVGYATLQVIPSMKGVAGALTGEAKTAGGAAGTAGGSAFMGGMGGAMKALAPAALVAGIGVGLFKIGENFDAAFDKIRVGTGATGKDLEGLKDSFRTVVQDVPSDFGDVASAIAEVNSRLGLTGKPLEDVTGQLLNLSRMTETDLMTNIESTTRLFGDWGIATENQSGTLDKLFRASQESGIGVSELSENMVKFGAPLRQIGFDFDTSAAMFANFEAEGVNVSKMMPGLNIALKKFAESGREPGQAFRETVEAIKTLPPEQAKLLAQQTFGTKAGLEWAAAIREGRFEFGDLQKKIVEGTDTINQASDDTEDFAEKWKKFSSTLQVAIEPLASAVFDSLGDALDVATEFGSKFIDEIRFSFAAGGWEGVGQLLQDKFASLLDGIIFKDQIIALVEGVIGILKTLFIGFFDTLRGLWDTFAGLFTGDWSRMWNGLVTLFQVPWNLIVGLLGAFAGMMASILAGAWDVIKLGAAIAWDAIKAALAAAWEAIRSAAQSVWDAIVLAISTAWNAIFAFLSAGVAALGALWSFAWEAMRAIAEAVWNAILAVISFIWNAIFAALSAGLAALSALWSFAWEAMRAIAETVWNAIMAVISFIWNAIQSLVSAGLAALANIWSFAWEGMRAIAETVWNAIVGFIQGAWDTISGIFSSIVSGISDIIGKFAEVAFASGAFNTVKDIIQEAGGAIVGWLGGIAGAIAGIVNALGDIPGAARDAIASLNPLKNVPGGGLIGGALAGGAAFGPVGLIIGGVLGFAKGGRPPLDRPSIIGEDGPELFWPDRAGTIIPNHDLDGSWSAGGDWDSAAQLELRAIRLELEGIRANQMFEPEALPSRGHVGGRR